ncbi:hypothetical protein QYE76_030474 [Lolium multiflorum]|uniref:Retrotransposon gag domain-containing protein n=1 Tax=Lolium multiflorum TaxID=4521 RepID=A0AAD8VIU3_LOLMU|nr:hypothetical protein QYE76_030474 [Lolium multiflorum]
MFSKTEEPLDADDWLQTMENNLEVAGVEAAEKVLFATHYLSGLARAWWNIARAMNGGQMMTWEDFKLKFSTSAHVIKKMRYAPDETDTNEKKKERFLNGLHDEMQTVLVNIPFADLEALVDYAIRMEGKLHQANENRMRMMNREWTPQYIKNTVASSPEPLRPCSVVAMDDLPVPSRPLSPAIKGGLSLAVFSHHLTPHSSLSLLDPLIRLKQILQRKYSRNWTKSTPRVLFFHGASETEGDTKWGRRGAATIGPRGRGPRRPMVWAPRRPPNLPFRLLLISFVAKTHTESHDTENLPENAAANPISGFGDRLRHLPERGIISGGLFITMIASGLMCE